MFIYIFLICIIAYPFLMNRVVHFICFFLTRNDRLTKRFPYPMDIIAHRGGSFIAPENTLYAYEKALNIGGTNMLEMDVWMSFDKKIVVSHDDDLSRTCGKKYDNVKISELVVGDFPERTLPQSLRVIPLYYKNGDKTFYEASADVPIDNRTRVCLLTEVFEIFPNIPMHIDIKVLSSEAVYAVLDMIRKYHREDFTIVGSSVSKNKAYIKKYFIKNPEIQSNFRIFANKRDFLFVYIYYYLGLLPFIKQDFDVFSIPVYTTSMCEVAKSEYGYTASLFVSFLLNSPTLWKYLQYRGIPVLGWVINGYSNLVQASRWPLNGIMTDDPLSLFNLRQSKKIS
ncbi:unnamed protein product [Phytomonas sp. Hart1]|nr:unnamed protein product [Phytomonas sp. Hart1]|eukprot:CCW68625.1 unnamed protein product [Phytomonas sp. isolate Hart1]